MATREFSRIFNTGGAQKFHKGIYSLFMEIGHPDFLIRNNQACHQLWILRGNSGWAGIFIAQPGLIHPNGTSIIPRAS